VMSFNRYETERLIALAKKAARGQEDRI